MLQNKPALTTLAIAFTIIASVDARENGEGHDRLQELRNNEIQVSPPSNTTNNTPNTGNSSQTHDEWFGDIREKSADWVQDLGKDSNEIVKEATQKAADTIRAGDDHDNRSSDGNNSGSKGSDNGDTSGNRNTGGLGNENGDR